MLKKPLDRYVYSDEYSDEDKPGMLPNAELLNFHVAPPIQCNTPWHEKYRRKFSVFSR